jgi:hypothetical protein
VTDFAGFVPAFSQYTLIYTNVRTCKGGSVFAPCRGELYVFGTNEMQAAAARVGLSRTGCKQHHSVAPSL